MDREGLQEHRSTRQVESDMESKRRGDEGQDASFSGLARQQAGRNGFKKLTQGSFGVFSQRSPVSLSSAALLGRGMKATRSTSAAVSCLAVGLPFGCLGHRACFVYTSAGKVSLQLFVCRAAANADSCTHRPARKRSRSRTLSCQGPRLLALGDPGAQALFHAHCSHYSSVSPFHPLLRE